MLINGHFFTIVPIQIYIVHYIIHTHVCQGPILAGYEYLGDSLGSDETGVIRVTLTLFLLRLLISSFILFISSYISLAARSPRCTCRHLRVCNDSLFLFMITPFFADCLHNSDLYIFGETKHQNRWLYTDTRCMCIG